MCEYKSDDVVWAKVEGYSWWPAIVVSVEKSTIDDELMVIVNFIGENSHSLLPSKKIANYGEKHEIYSKTGKKNLRLAIEKADKYIAERGFPCGKFYLNFICCRVQTDKKERSTQA